MVTLTEKLASIGRPSFRDGKLVGMGADPLEATRAVDARSSEDNRTDASQARAESDVERDIRQKTLADQAEKTRKEFEFNVRSADAINIVARAREHDGRKLCSPHDASIIRQIETLIHLIAGKKPAPLDPVFAEPENTRPINSAVDRAVREVPVTIAPQDDGDVASDNGLDPYKGDSIEITEVRPL